MAEKEKYSGDDFEENEDDYAESLKSEKCKRSEKICEIKEKIDILKKDFLDCVHAIMPKETAKHLSNSKKEFLLAVRSLIDKEIAGADKTQEEKEEKDKND